MGDQSPHGAGEPQLATLLDPARPLMAVDPLPPAADVVVIGGGIVGCSIAYFLARRGVGVVVCEKGRIGGEQSGRNWGWVRQQGRAAAELPMMMRSNAIWRGWVDELGEDTGFHQGGCLYLARTTDELESHTAWLDVARAHGLETRLVTGAELERLLAGGARWAGALYTPSDARAEPGRAVPAIARAAVRAGASVCEHCAVRGIETAGGRVSAVVTERGSIRTGTVVCAAGAWTSLFAGSVGVRVPQLKIKGTVARTVPAPEVCAGTAWASDVAIRRRLDGGYTVAHGRLLEHAVVPATLRHGRRFLPALRRDHGTVRLRLNTDFWRELIQPRRWPLDRATVFERHRVLDPRPTPSLLERTRDALAASFPEIGAPPFAETWAGMIEASPDLLPILGESGSLPGFVVATGFSGHGFGLGPGAGECLADLVTGTESEIDLHPFRPDRFFDGSRLEPGPSI